ncbi:hypothetical protein Tco_1452958 [Tanacetum coccineum]
MVEGVWYSNSSHVKQYFFNIYKEKFQNHASNEIKNAIWDCGSSKSPSPDGFWFPFLKSYWDVLKGDVEEFVSTFLATGQMPVGANSAFITLIPKVIDWYKKKNKKLMIFKVDFEKAFDSGLHVAIKEESQSRLIKRVSVGNLNFNLSHLFYADDVVIVSDWNKEDMDNIIRVLNVFYLASWLKININKSNVYSVGVSTEEIESMASLTRCFPGSLPFNYLCLPIGANMNKVSRWNTLVDRFRAKVSSWKANMLSIDGRLTLLKMVLGSVGTYYMSIFKVPATINKLLESLRATFF